MPAPTNMMKFSRIANAISSRCSTSRRTITFGEDYVFEAAFWDFSIFVFVERMMFNEIENNFNCAAWRWWEGGETYTAAFGSSLCSNAKLDESNCLFRFYLRQNVFLSYLSIFGFPDCHCTNLGTMNECMHNKLLALLSMHRCTFNRLLS